MLWQYHYDKFSVMWFEGDRYFFYKKEGLQNQSILYTQVGMVVPTSPQPHDPPTSHRSPHLCLPLNHSLTLDPTSPRTQDSLDSPPRVLVDPNTLRADGTASLGGVYITEDAKTLAYTVSYSGSDWQTVYLK